MLICGAPCSRRITSVVFQATCRNPIDDSAPLFANTYERAGPGIFLSRSTLARVFWGAFDPRPVSQMIRSLESRLSIDRADNPSVYACLGVGDGGFIELDESSFLTPSSHPLRAAELLRARNRYQGFAIDRYLLGMDLEITSLANVSFCSFCNMKYSKVI